VVPGRQAHLTALDRAVVRRQARSRGRGLLLLFLAAGDGQEQQRPCEAGSHGAQRAEVHGQGHNPSLARSRLHANLMPCMSAGTPGSAAAGAPEWAAPPWLATGGAEICAAPVQTVQQNAPRHIRRETNSRLSMGCSPDGRLSEWCHNCPATRPVHPQSIRKTFARQSIATRLFCGTLFV